MTSRALGLILLLTLATAAPLLAGTVEVGVDLIVRDSNLHARAAGSVAYRSIFGYYTSEMVSYDLSITNTYAGTSGALATPYNVSVESSDPVEDGSCYQGILAATANDSSATATSNQICYAGPPTPQQCSLTVLVSGGGTTSDSGGTKPYYCGTSVTLTATAGSGWRFSYWSGAISGSANPMTFILSTDMSVTANFEELPPPPPDPGPQCGDADWQSGCSPIVIALGDGPYRLTGADDPVSFDISASGVPRSIGWTAAGADEAFLALDRDHNGSIDSGAELFGTATPLRDGSPALNGFVALREFDANGDGVIDAEDPIWSQLVLWRDLDHDGISEADELQPIASSEVTAIAVDARWTGRRDVSGNYFKYQSTVWLKRQTGDAHPKPVYDIFFVPAD